MPELPEVETVVRGLRKRIVGRRLGKVRYQSPLIQVANTPRWEDQIAESAVRSVERRGKYIIVNLVNGEALIIHLRMTGRISIKPDDYRPQTHDRFIIQLKPEQQLVLTDTRQFARVQWCAGGLLAHDRGLARLGMDALEIGADQFAVLCRSARRPIKSFLLDQSRLAGVGNIYADESLFAAGIRPTTLANSIGRERLKRLHTSMRGILRLAIRACGTTFDTFSDLEGKSGGFGPRLKVYGRQGLPCPACGSPIRRIVIAGRGTHFCPRCQRR